MIAFYILINDIQIFVLIVGQCYLCSHLPNTHCEQNATLNSNFKCQCDKGFKKNTTSGKCEGRASLYIHIFETKLIFYCYFVTSIGQWSLLCLFQHLMKYDLYNVPSQELWHTLCNVTLLSNFGFNKSIFYRFKLCISNVIVMPLTWQFS